MASFLDPLADALDKLPSPIGALEIPRHFDLMSRRLPAGPMLPAFRLG
jgi:hypothetical protein